MLPKMAIVTVSIVVVLIVLINCLNTRGSMTASGAVGQEHLLYINLVADGIL